MSSEPRPGWHGVPPSAERFVAPVQREPPVEPVIEPVEALPIWVRLEYPDKHTETVKSFAMAWTEGAVLAQWVEFSQTRKAWVRPNQCRRREIPAKSRFRT